MDNSYRFISLKYIYDKGYIKVLESILFIAKLLKKLLVNFSLI